MKEEVTEGNKGGKNIEDIKEIVKMEELQLNESSFEENLKLESLEDVNCYLLIFELIYIFISINIIFHNCFLLIDL